MKKLLLIFLFVALLVSCSQSPAAIQKAISKTQSAMPKISPSPLPSATPTPIPLSEYKLENI